MLLLLLSLFLIQPVHAFEINSCTIETAITLSYGTPNTVLILDDSDKVISSDVTTTELGYIENVTSDIQAQLNSKQSALSFIDSLVNSGGNVSLVGDSASPGATQYYGTNGSSVLGFYSIPATGVSSVTATAPIVSSGGSTPNLTCNVASGSQPGCLASSDWTTFNSKQSSLSFGDLTSTPTTNLVVTGGSNAVIGSGATLTLTGASIVESTSSVLSLTGATNAVLGTGVSIQVKQASTSQSGYLSSTDWNTFNSKQAGLSFIDSLVDSGGSVSLVGDSASPGATKYYGTNGSSVLGFYSIPSGGVSSVTATAPLVSSGGGTPNLTCNVASGSQPGCLASADWNTFNGKQSSLTFGNLTDAGTDGIVVTGGTGSVIGSGTSFAQQVANTTQNGYLASTDWNTFNSKQASGSYITALTGDGSATGPGSATFTLASVGTAGTYPKVTVNAKGLVTSGTTLASGDIPNNAANTSGNAATVTTNANMTGDVTSVGNATSLVATTNSSLATLSGLTTAASLATIGTITTGVWNGTGTYTSQQFVVSGTTMTLPSTITTSSTCELTMIGGGGGGGGSSLAKGSGAGGGAGAAAVYALTGLTPSSSHTIAIGAAGSAGTSAGGAGGAGGNTTFMIDSTHSLETSGGGGGAAAATISAAGGFGGSTISTTDLIFKVVGQNGFSTGQLLSSPSGAGGSTIMGSGGGAVISPSSSTAETGLVGTGYGSGGSGGQNGTATTAAAGGAGATGAILMKCWN